MCQFTSFVFIRGHPQFFFIPRLTILTAKREIDDQQYEMDLRK